MSVLGLSKTNISSIFFVAALQMVFPSTRNAMAEGQKENIEWEEPTLEGWFGRPATPHAEQIVTMSGSVDHIAYKQLSWFYAELGELIRKTAPDALNAIESQTNNKNQNQYSIYNRVLDGTFHLGGYFIGLESALRNLEKDPTDKNIARLKSQLFDLESFKFLTHDSEISVVKHARSNEKKLLEIGNSLIRNKNRSDDEIRRHLNSVVDMFVDIRRVVILWNGKQGQFERLPFKIRDELETAAPIFRDLAKLYDLDEKSKISDAVDLMKSDAERMDEGSKLKAKLENALNLERQIREVVELLPKRNVEYSNEIEVSLNELAKKLKKKSKGFDEKQHSNFLSNLPEFLKSIEKLKEKQASKNFLSVSDGVRPAKKKIRTKQGINTKKRKPRVGH